MALNLKSIGETIGPIQRSYTWKEVVVYALGVGAGFGELDYVYEKNLKVIPTFSIASIVEFIFEALQPAGVNLAGILHGGQELIFHRSIPISGTLNTTGRITHIYDKKEKGAVIVAESITYHSNGEKLFTAVFTIFSRLDGGFGGESAPSTKLSVPDENPDLIVHALPSPDQPLIYRLSGDVFPLHVDPKFARKAGFERPIMHGLCTLGYACRALLGSFTPGQPELVKRINCRFTRPLYPGDPIETHIWKIDNGKALWKIRNTKTGETVIDGGEFQFEERSSK